MKKLETSLTLHEATRCVHSWSQNWLLQTLSLFPRRPQCTLEILPRQQIGDRCGYGITQTGRLSLSNKGNEAHRRRGKLEQCLENFLKDQRRFWKWKEPWIQALGLMRPCQSLVTCFAVNSLNFWTLIFLTYKYRGNTYSL